MILTVKKIKGQTLAQYVCDSMASILSIVENL